MTKTKTENSLSYLAEILVVSALIGLCRAQSYDQSYDQSNIVDEEGLSTSRVLILRNYSAVDHYITTEDGCTLNLVEATNPLIDYSSSQVASKVPVLFLHGTLSNGTIFIFDTPNASPRDYSELNANDMSIEQIRGMYNGSSNVESLVILLLDRGYRVFILNRRGTVNSQCYISGGNESQTSIGRFTGRDLASNFLSTLTSPLTALVSSVVSTIDPHRYNFSLDEEAKYDVPLVVKYILTKLNVSSLAFVCWSSGCQITLMALSDQPDLNPMRILWAPSMYLGTALGDTLIYRQFGPFASQFIGPILPEFVNYIIGELAINLCTTKLTQAALCQPALDFILGYGGDTELIKPGFLNSAPAPISSHHFAQLGQTSDFGKTHHYDLGITRNQAIYGSSVPPLYDVRKITAKNMHLWAAINDNLVSPVDVANLANDMGAQTNLTIFPLDDNFNHGSYFTHINKAVLVLIKSLQLLEA